MPTPTRFPNNILYAPVDCTLISVKTDSFVIVARKELIKICIQHRIGTRIIKFKVSDTLGKGEFSQREQVIRNYNCYSPSFRVRYIVYDKAPYVCAKTISGKPRLKAGTIMQAVL